MSKDKKILILGAGIYQVPLIKTAKKMGLFTVVASWKGNYPGFKVADKIYYEDTKNIKGILEIAKSENIAGICTSGTDVATPSIGKVSDELNLNGISYESSILSTNKLEMKKAFEEFGVRTPLYRKVSTIKEAINAYDEIKKPVIFKAVDSSGSRGIVKVDDKGKISYAYNQIKNNTNKDYFIIEQYISGIESGAQGFVRNNNFEFIMPHGDIVTFRDTAFPIIHFVPYKINKEILADLKEQLIKGIKALKINNSAINADFIISNNKIYVLEIGARSGGNCLSELVSIYYGFNYYEQIINSALGTGPNFNFTSLQPAASMTLISEIDGTIKKIRNKNTYNENIIDIIFDYNKGERIKKFLVGCDRIGHIIVKHDTVEKALSFLDEVRSNIEIVIDPV